MKLTEDILKDLIPLYVANECSANTRVLVEEYLQNHPQEAEEVRRIMATSISSGTASPKSSDEMRALREARRRLRRRSWLMALAIFFSLAPFSFAFGEGKSWWMLRDAPGSALVYAGLAVVLWSLYAIERRRTQDL
jgi:ferric-dicitrate binding protein FerR (iron transport regulator)